MKNVMRTVVLLGIFSSIIFYTACEKNEFNGNKICNDNEFILEYSEFNTTYEHSLSLEEGDVIHCNIEADEGTLDISIEKDDGVSAYRGNDVSSGSFDVRITEAGEYTITVTGDEAVGRVSFEKKE